MTRALRISALAAVAACAFVVGFGRCDGQSISPGWVMLDSVTPRVKFDRIECANEDDCIALGRDGLSKRSFLYATTDGRASWIRVCREEEYFAARHFDGRYLDIAHPSTLTTAVLCKFGWVISTIDGGTAWRLRQIQDTNATAISFADSRSGVIRGARNLWLTRDGGDWWQEIELPRDTVNLVVGRAVMPSADILLSFPYRRGGSAFAIRSDDTGRTWRVGSVVDGARAVSFIDRDNGWIAASKGTGIGTSVFDVIYRTDDGGMTWRNIYEQVGSPPFDMRDLDFVDVRHGIAGGISSKLQMTSDGGATWVRQYVGSDTNRLAQYWVDYPSPTRAYAVTDEGGVYRFDERPGSTWSSGHNSAAWVLDARVSDDHRLDLRLRGAASTVHIAISNAAGEFVYRKRLGAFDRVSSISLLSGVYFVQVSDGIRLRSQCLIVP